LGEARTMSTVPFLFIFLLAWGIHAVVALVVATPVVFFGRKRFARGFATTSNLCSADYDNFRAVFGS
jgi:hypothetical protein